MDGGSFLDIENMKGIIRNVQVEINAVIPVSDDSLNGFRTLLESYAVGKLFNDPSQNNMYTWELKEREKRNKDVISALKKENEKLRSQIEGSTDSLQPLSSCKKRKREKTITTATTTPQIMNENCPINKTEQINWK